MPEKYYGPQRAGKHTEQPQKKGPKSRQGKTAYSHSNGEKKDKQTGETLYVGRYAAVVGMSRGRDQRGLLTICNT